MNDDEKLGLQKLVQQKESELAEHFESVQIMVTRHVGEEENTFSLEVGRGNFYTRLGHVHEWLSMQDQFQRNESIRRDTKSNC